ncbi:SAVMC3_10250 family protein [Streptomyces mirabilis]|uniref:SAVMC3_10250 family protein n=1 Tax=Streptomyces mirabilis TaxID=68239 RepID=UPI0033F40AC4
MRLKLRTRQALVSTIVSLDRGWPMQELIYLSQAKLRQFVPQERRWTRLGRRLTNFRLDVPAAAGGGGVELGLAEGRDEAQPGNLAAVLQRVEEHALWYQDPKARAGRWVYFEAPLNVVTCRWDGFKTVLFLDAPAARTDESGRGGLRLILHGSASHLLAPAPALPVRAWQLGLEGSGLSYTFESLQDSRLADPLQPPPDRPPRLGEFDYSYVRLATLEVSDANPGSAAWMRGYARVTLIAASENPTPRRPQPTPPILMATPLYVEYAHDLPD